MPRWEMRQVDGEAAARLAGEAGLPTALARILVSRGITTAAEARVFLSPSISDLHDPLLMDQMDAAVNRLRLARERGERVLLFGDYDVDGITATAAMGRILEALGLPYSVCHPHRLAEGYGFNSRGVEIAHKKGASLIVALDCGTGAVGPVSEARSRGIDVIVIDHHIQKEGELSPARAIVNPKKRACPYPFEELVTAGLVLKVARALVEAVPLDIPWHELLQLAALATVADVAPLRGENRIITRLGIEEFRRGPLPGLAALARVAGINAGAMRAGNLAMQLGPRINAAGRIGSPEIATRLLFERSPAACARLAAELHDLNGRRQAMEKGILDEALDQIERGGGAGERKAVVVAGRGWHRGVVGIVAARLVEKYYRPAVVLAVDDGHGHGSARSIPAFDLFGALSRCEDLFSSFGGHRAAAGLSLPAEKIAAFTERLESIADDLLADEDLVPTLLIDTEIGLAEITFDLLGLLDRLEPFGRGNPRPVFSTAGVGLIGGARRMGRNRDHLRMKLGPAGRGGRALDCVGWRMAGTLPRLGSGPLDVAYTPEINEWRGVKSIRLVLKDIRQSGQEIRNCRAG